MAAPAATIASTTAAAGAAAGPAEPPGWRRPSWPFPPGRPSRAAAAGGGPRGRPPRPGPPGGGGLVGSRVCSPRRCPAGPMPRARRSLPHTRSSFLVAASALLFAGAASALDDPEVRRAAALLDYVARGYPTAVVEGRVINPAEFDEQQAFAQEAAEMLERPPAGRPLAPEARRLENQIRARAAFAEH